jgi:hypothetical protein
VQTLPRLVQTLPRLVHEPCIRCRRSRPCRRPDRRRAPRASLLAFLRGPVRCPPPVWR